MTGTAWHRQTSEAVLRVVQSSSEGLTTDEASARLERFGSNELVDTGGKSIFSMLLDQFRDFMILVLLAAAVISGFIGEVVDTIAIIVIVILNAIIGFVQEYRAEKAMKALKKMAAPSALVKRNGLTLTIPAAELVPGDIVFLDAGRVVPADMRIIESVNLRIEEAALTGESVPSEKHATIIEDDDIPLGDRRNMAYKGTFVTYGRGEAVVIGTGMQTELGKIAAMLQEEEEVKTPLQKRLAAFGQRLALAVIAICAIVFFAGMLRGENPLLMLLTAISLAVAAIPEALPAVITISLALGAKKLVRQNALVRKLPAVETLGSVTFICSDKTGTLTVNRMTVEEIHVNGETARVGNIIFKAFDAATLSSNFQSPEMLFLLALALNNDTSIDDTGQTIGDPTEIALYQFAKNNGYARADLEKYFPRVAEIPFDSERKCMTTFHRLPGGIKGVDPVEAAGFISITKGAVESIADKASSEYAAEGMRSYSQSLFHKITDRMAADGLRVLGVAFRYWKELPRSLDHDAVERDLVFVGLAGMLDPPREEAGEAVALCKTAGIRPTMITGDHPMTARTIARRIGILEDERLALITGRELDKLPLEEFEERVEKIRVYARVAPEQKLKIVRALQDRGQFVAMTGDGVNDAPALRRADIGVAMGITGTDVSKEAADMILLDDNFATIVKSVREGRRIYDNIRKFIRYTMTSNSGEIWTIFLAPFLGLPIPLLPIHILWINLVTDGLPGLALAAEPAEREVMKRPPRHPRESIFSHGLGFQVVWVGLLMGAVTLLTQAWAIRTGHEGWQTMVFTVLCLSQMGNVLSIRSEKESFFSIGIFSNKPLLGAVLLTFLLQLATIYVPFLNPIFRTTPLTLAELGLALGVSSIVFLAVETDKFIRRKRIISDR